MNAIPSRVSLGLILAVGIVPTAAAEDLPVARAGPAARLSVDQIIQGLRRLHDQFDPAKNSFSIHYTQEHRKIDPQGNPEPHEDYWTEIVNARKGALSYTRLKQKNATYRSPVEEFYVWRDHITQQRIRDMVSLYDHLIPQNYQYFRYTECLGLNALRLMEYRNRGEEKAAYGAKGPGENPAVMWVYETLVDFKARFRVRPRVEEVGGSWCHVLEWPDHMAYWIDDKHGFLLVRATNDYHGEVNAAQFNSDLFEAKPGVWLPRRQETWNFGVVDEGKPPKLVRKDYIKLHTIEFNKLDDAFFKLPIDPEEQLDIVDSVRKMQYYKYPPGRDPAENALAGMRGEFEMGYTRTWLLVNGIIVGIIGFFYLRSCLRRPGGAGVPVPTAHHRGPPAAGGAPITATGD